MRRVASLAALACALCAFASLGVSSDAVRGNQEAIVTLRGESWVDYGWPKGTPVLSVAGQRVTGTKRTNAIRVRGSAQLTRMTVAIDKDSVSFLVDVLDGHDYTVEPDPCCFLTVGDAKAELLKRAQCGTKDRCPKGMHEVDKFAFRRDDCGQRLTCAPPARLGISVSIDGETPEAWGSKYRDVATGREAPQRVEVSRDGRVLWQDRVILRMAMRYTLVVPDHGTPSIVVDH